MILKIEDYKIVLIQNQGDILTSIDLLHPKFQFKKHYWDKYNFVKNVLETCAIEGDFDPIRIYPFRSYIDKLRQKDNSYCIGYLNFDLDTDYTELVEDIRDFWNEYWSWNPII